jgi:hypothetical protein
VDPTGRYLRALCPQFDQQRVLSRFFSLYLFQRPPSPPSWRNEKPRLRSLMLEPNPTAIREKLTERKTALETTESTTRRLKRIKI